ncbi:hypothetical protein PMKS-002275 [Pichia membranifaciens]|uniref:Uncharacterized protein n=1 Tax=Pichia membranifaciens TaxID=4926 RepID=A0A1Q2YGX7_9ASCO|nr:hypothetical protein PMKS-002275 [Pichia membranifaciens]
MHEGQNEKGGTRPQKQSTQQKGKTTWADAGGFVPQPQAGNDIGGNIFDANGEEGDDEGDEDEDESEENGSDGDGEDEDDEDDADDGDENDEEEDGEGEDESDIELNYPWPNDTGGTKDDPIVIDLDDSLRASQTAESSSKADGHVLEESDEHEADVEEEEEEPGAANSSTPTGGPRSAAEEPIVIDTETEMDTDYKDATMNGKLKFREHEHGSASPKRRRLDNSSTFDLNGVGHSLNEALRGESIKVEKSKANGKASAKDKRKASRVQQPDAHERGHPLGDRSPDELPVQADSTKEDAHGACRRAEREAVAGSDAHVGTASPAREVLSHGKGLERGGRHGAGREAPQDLTVPDTSHVYYHI